MRRSLQRQLSRGLAVAILVAGIAAAAVSFAFAFEQAQELQDQAIRQIAGLAAQGGVGRAAALQDRSQHADVEPDSRIIVISLSAPSRPAWLPADLQPGFHTLSDAPEPMRVYVSSARGKRIAVAQPTDLRNDSAVDSALITLLPLLGLLPALVWLTTQIIRREFCPVRKLAAALDEQRPEDPQPLPAEELPAEIASFVESINRLLMRINELIGAQRRFIADAAHELRSPLTALQVQTENLEQAETPQDRWQRVAALRSGIERARHLTEQLLDLARLQTTGTDRAHVNASRLARELIAEYIPFAEQRGVDIGMQADGELDLEVSPSTLRLILKNALDNAVRYTPSGGQVTVRLASEDGSDVIEIIDTGPGIPDAEVCSIFAPFYRIAGTSGEGSGLGLAIAQDVAERCGAAISVRRRPDGPGTIFRYCQRGIS